MIEILLQDITACDETLTSQLLDIRNLPAIRSAMYSDHLINTQEHTIWLNNLHTDNKQKVFIIVKNSNAIGLISLSAIDMVHKKSDWAFYIQPSEQGGLGKALEWAYINYAFDTVGLEKLNCEVLETNPVVVNLHKRFHFQHEGFRRSNIVKNDVRIGVHLMGLTRDDWNAAKASVQQDISKTLSNFNICFTDAMDEKT